MSSTYTVSPTVVSFTAMSDSWSEQSGAQVDVMPFPGGDAIAISLGGQRGTTRTFKALLASRTDYQTLASIRGRQGTLVVENWDTAGAVNAVLKQISPDPIQADGKVYAQVQFVLY